MATYITVVPGVDMSAALDGKRVTKKFLRDYMRTNPQKDFYVVGGPAVNGEDALRADLTLQVVDRKDPGTVVAMVNFQKSDANEWGYQAVVR